MTKGLMLQPSCWYSLMRLEIIFCAVLCASVVDTAASNILKNRPIALDFGVGGVILSQLFL